MGQSINLMNRASGPLARVLRREDPRALASGVHIVFLHGGAFAYPQLPMHWLIIAVLINRIGATVTVPFYAVAPESTFDDSVGAVDAVVQDRAGRLRRGPVILAGDSSRGNLAILAALRTRDQAPRSRQTSCCSPHGWTSARRTPSWTS